jgi:hypothetical protein
VKVTSPDLFSESDEFLGLDFCDGFVDSLEFRDTKFLENFFHGRDAAKLPAQAVWTAGVLAQYQFCH